MHLTYLVVLTKYTGKITAGEEYCSTSFQTGNIWFFTKVFLPGINFNICTAAAESSLLIAVHAAVSGADPAVI